MCFWQLSYECISTQRIESVHDDIVWHFLVCHIMMYGVIFTYASKKTIPVFSITAHIQNVSNLDIYLMNEWKWIFDGVSYLYSSVQHFMLTKSDLFSSNIVFDRIRGSLLKLKSSFERVISWKSHVMGPRRSIMVFLIVHSQGFCEPIEKKERERERKSASINNRWKNW